MKSEITCEWETAMNEEVQILPLVLLTGLAAYLGYEINRRRHKLRRIFNTFDKRESRIAAALESLVESGQLKPYVPGQSS
jgi:hypothetical protein